MAAADADIKSLLGKAVYRHSKVLDVMTRAEDRVSRLFVRYISDPSALPGEWRLEAGADERRRHRRVADFLAGMTDRYALQEFARLFDEPPELS
jgi:dGTPase